MSDKCGYVKDYETQTSTGLHVCVFGLGTGKQLHLGTDHGSYISMRGLAKVLHEMPDEAKEELCDALQDRV